MRLVEWIPAHTMSIGREARTHPVAAHCDISFFRQSQPWMRPIALILPLTVAALSLTAVSRCCSIFGTAAGVDGESIADTRTAASLAMRSGSAAGSAAASFCSALWMTMWWWLWISGFIVKVGEIVGLSILMAGPVDDAAVVAAGCALTVRCSCATAVR
jgi:hypothetical protein